MKLSFPLVTYYAEGRRTGYLVNVAGDYGRVQPIGPIGTVPAKLKIPLKDLRLDKTGLEPTKDSLPADAEEQNLKLDKERITMADKKSKAVKTAKEKAPAIVKVLTLTDKAPETKDLKEGSHAYAVIAGLRRLKGQGTRERLLEVIAEAKMLKTDMDPSVAVSWMIGQLKGKGYLKVVKQEVTA
jgi:hypothetical protein